MAEYDAYGNLKAWRLGGFGYKQKTGAKSYYYIKDHIGNIRVTVDENGAIVGKDDYYPFGLSERSHAKGRRAEIPRPRDKWTATPM